MNTTKLIMFGKKNERKATIERFDNGYVVVMSGELFSHIPDRKRVCISFADVVRYIEEFLEAPEDNATEKAEA